MKNKIKNIIDGLIMAPILLIGAVCVINGMATLSLPLMLIPLPFMVISADRLIGDVKGNFIKKSIFSVSRHGKIEQDTLRNPLNIFKIIKSKNKKEFLLREEFKMFKQLPKKDSKGREKLYYTISQSLTVKSLKKLEKEGYIKNLHYEETNESALFFEKLLIGNLKKKKKKNKMFHISFNLTDKKIDDDAYQMLTSSQKENKENKNNKKKKERKNLITEKTLSRQEQIEELKNLRTTLTSDDIENNHTKSSKMW